MLYLEQRQVIIRQESGIEHIPAQLYCKVEGQKCMLWQISAWITV